MNFGQAIEALKQGKRITRTGWNGKGMYLFLLPAATVPLANIHTEPLRSIAEANGGTVKCRPAIRMLCADGSVLTGWHATQGDMLGEDWCVVGE